MDRRRSDILDVVLWLVEELEKLNGLVPILGGLEHSPGFAVELGHERLAGRTNRLRIEHAEIAASHRIWSVLLVETGTAPPTHDHGGLATRQIAHSAKEVSAQPIRSQAAIGELLE